MFRLSKILMFGVFALVAGYTVFAAGRPADATDRVRLSGSPAATYCMVEHYFQFHEMAQRLGLNTMRAPLGFDPCSPGQVAFGWAHAYKVTDDQDLD